VVHEHLLTHYSGFFRAALTGGFKEAEDKTVKLKEDQPLTFELFVHWLYYQRFPDKSKGDADEITSAWANGDDEINYGWTKSRNLINLHVFSDRYNIPQLFQKSMDELYWHITQDCAMLPPVASIDTAFSALDQESPMCRYLVHVHCCTKREEWEVLDREDYPEDFLWKALLRYADIATKGETKVYWKLKLCDYHNHVTDEEQEACKKEQKRRKRMRI
jgi:hypothetical protein